MDQGKVLFRVKCSEPEGEVVRTVRLAKISIAKLKFYWDKLNEFDVLFNDFVGDDVDSFIHGFLAQVGEDIIPTGIIWEVDDVGIIRLSSIKPAFECEAHFSFWDRRLRGREPIIREALRYGIKRYQFHRVYCEIPLYTRPTMKFVERVGFTKEGRKREAVLWKGEWHDANLYSILDHEVVSDGGQISRAG